MASKYNEVNPVFQKSFHFIISMIITLSVLTGCGPSTAEIAAVDYRPLEGDDWEVSTPEEEGLDPKLVADLYQNASELESINGLLVIKNGSLVAEQYFHGGSVEQISARHSATKSYTSALVGIALEQGCLASLDQKMMDFFPEFEGQITDPRKKQITVRHLLQMRAGYPYDSTEYFGDVLYLSGDWQWLPHLVDFPLVSDPGTEVAYSSLSSHILGVIVARACDTDLETFAEEHLFGPTNTEIGNWTRDVDGYNWGWGELYVTARDMGKFGLLYLSDGEFQGEQVISSDWVQDSLEIYSEDAWVTKKIGRYFKDTGYGYQWWSARVGNHHFKFVWGHGGQLIVLLEELDLIIVTTADPLNHLAPADGWKYEETVIDLVGAFIKSLPSD
jgi:CubicO group peptidase (beta-lactamase class C family)